MKVNGTRLLDRDEPLTQDFLMVNQPAFAFANDLSDQAFDDLVQDIRINGQLTPIEALPDGTIICGHQRARVAKTLGWTEVDV